MIKRKLAILLIALLFLSELTHASKPHAMDSLNLKIDQLFNQEISAGSPGCAAGIFEAGKISYQGFFGMANLASKQKINSNTQFRLASNSKQFTATIIALLEQKKLLSLADPLSKYFPKFPNYAASITLADLIHHTSGLRDYFVLSELAGIPPSESFSKEYALQLLLNQKSTNFEPGSKFSYSNAGYILLAEIIERKTKKPFRQIAKELIFDPLSMHHSVFDDKSSSLSNDVAVGYLPEQVPFTYQMDMTGAGGMISNIKDFAKWDNNFYQNILSNSDDFIEKITAPGKLRDGIKHHYAFGLEILQYGDYIMQYHGGEIEGALTEFIRIPEKNISIALFCNNSDIASFGLAMSMLKLKLPLNDAEAGSNEHDGKQELNLSNLTKKLDTTKKAFNVLQYVGHYWNSMSIQENQIINNNGTLILLRENGRKQELHPIAPGQFKILNVPYEAILTFTKNSLNGWDMLINFDNGQFINNFVQFDKVAYKDDELQKFVGSYYSQELDITYKISHVNSALELNFAKLSKIKLEPLMSNVLSYTPFYDKNTLKFHHDNENKIIGFSLNSPRAKNLHFKVL